MADVVVGYDGSDCAKAALAAAIEAAQALGDRLVIVYGAAVNPMGGEVADLAAAIDERARTISAEGAETARAAGVEVEVEVVRDRAAAALIAVADRRDARMIVVGTYGEHPIKGAILGSTPHRLLHLSERPVLVVPTRTT